jgi:outer membrane biosynthesis protein TonB
MATMLGVSLAVHGLVVFASRGAERATPELHASTQPELPLVDLWTGDTTEPGVDAPEPAMRSGPKPPTIAAPASPTERPEPPLPGLALAPGIAHRPVTSPPSPTLKTKPPTPTRAPWPRTRAAAPVASAAQDSGAGARATTEAVSGTGGTIGVEGPAAIRDLGRAFTRALPAACVADPGWADLPAGEVGNVIVRIRLDEEGHVADWEPRSASPPAQLLRALKRTVAMLGAGTFRVRDAAGAGVDAFRLRAHVSDEPAPTGAIALEQTWAGGHGEAAFTQASGRRIRVVIDRVRPD